ncbi:MAG: hypothetical protein AAGK32_16360 [Actinomycetota bacterium]
MAEGSGDYELTIRAPVPPGPDAAPDAPIEEVVVEGSGQYDFATGHWRHSVDLAPIFEIGGGLPGEFSSEVEYAFVDDTFYITSDLLAAVTDPSTPTVTAESIDQFYGPDGLEAGGVAVLTAGLAANPIGMVAPTAATTDIADVDDQAPVQYRGSLSLADAYGAPPLTGITPEISERSTEDAHYGLLGTDPEPAADLVVSVGFAFENDVLGLVSNGVDYAELGDLLADELPDADQLAGEFEATVHYRPGATFDYGPPSRSESVTAVRYTTEF